MAERTVLRQGDLTLSVAAPADDLRWIEEFFGAGYAADRAARASVEIGLSADERPLTGEPPIGERLAFALDSGPIHLPAFEKVGYLERLFEPDTAIAYDISADRPAVAVRYAGNRPTARVRLMRAVREYFHNASLQAGGVVLHAAAIVHDGRAIVIAGGRGAGKTTMLLRLLRAADTSFLSNDRVLVTGDSTPQARAIPTVVSLRDGTLALMPDIARRLLQAGDFRSHRAERLMAAPAAPVRAGEAIRLDAGQLCDAAGRPMVPGAPLGAVIVIDDAIPAGDPRRLAPDEAVPVLASSLVGSRVGVYASDVFTHAPVRLAAPRRTSPAHTPHLSHPPSQFTLLRRTGLASMVPCFLSGRLEDDASAVAQLLSICAHADA